MVGLHLGAKCLICVKPLPAADRQEDTSAKLLGQFIHQYRMKNTPKVIPLKKKMPMNSLLFSSVEGAYANLHHQKMIKFQETHLGLNKQKFEKSVFSLYLLLKQKSLRIAKNLNEVLIIHSK